MRATRGSSSRGRSGDATRDGRPGRRVGSGDGGDGDEESVDEET